MQTENKILLSGQWQLKLGAYEDGDAEKILSDSCILPGTLDENRKGTPNQEPELKKLSRKYIYTGKALYQKTVEFPESWAGKTVSFLMERTKITRLWLNGREQKDCPSCETLGTPQIYVLKGWRAGQPNVLTAEVENENYPIRLGTHMLTEETVTNWNGILGRIELNAQDPVHIKNVRIYPDIVSHSALVKLTAAAPDKAGYSGTVRLQARSLNHEGEKQTVPEKFFSFSIPAGNSEAEVEFSYPMGENPRLWSEFDPALYRMTLTLTAGDSRDEQQQTFGMRNFQSVGHKFQINGLTTFLRGEANSCVFPLTGYAYMTKEEWKQFFSAPKKLGINFFRFHSWTPPEAAFEAADELGIYMQPELYSFGGTPFQPKKDSTRTSDYFFAEAIRILSALANHPSFVMMSWGNELGTEDEESRGWADKLRNSCQNFDPTRCYAEGSNNNYWAPSLNPDDDYWTIVRTKINSEVHQIRLSYAWVDENEGGRIETMLPGTDFTYEEALEEFPKPVMSHEIGQYQVLPLFDREIPKYAPGIFEPRNLQAYRDLMEKKGLLSKNELFSRASARISAIGYRAEMEAALRTPNMGGYQLLSIQDFPGQGTAHVGLLDNFMEPKIGGIPLSDYRNFNGPVVVLGMVPRFIWTSDEILTGKICVPNYSPNDLRDLEVYWALKDGERILEQGILPPAAVPQGQAVIVGEFAAESIRQLKEAKKLVLEVGAKSLNLVNTYPVWVYPAGIGKPDAGEVQVCTRWDEDTRTQLEKGKKVLLLPEISPENLPRSVPVRWATDFWSGGFHRDEIHAYTMGMVLSTEHPVFRDFPTDFYSDAQWFRLMKGSRALILDDLPAEPIARNIDHMQWSRKLGSLFEARTGAGKLMVCTFDLLHRKDTEPEARQLYSSILRYMNSPEFEPEIQISAEDLTGLFRKKETE